MQQVFDELVTADAEADRLVAGLSEDAATYRARPGAWSVAECLDHVAAFNAAVLEAMRAAADRARQKGQTRRGPVGPDLAGRLLIRFLEPPVALRVRTIPAVVPPQRPLPAAVDAFRASQAEVRTFLRASRDLDLRVRFTMPFSRLMRVRLATGFRVIAVHERRHLWQAWRAREAAERALGGHAAPAQAPTARAHA